MREYINSLITRAITSLNDIVICHEHAVVQIPSSNTVTAFQFREAITADLAIRDIREYLCFARQYIYFAFCFLHMNSARLQMDHFQDYI